MSLPLLSLLLLAAPPPARDLLRDADRARGAVEGGLTWTVAVESTEDGETTRAVYRVRARGVDALAEALAPPRRKGEVILFNDRSLWFVKPGLRRPISISSRQRLQGEAATGDITSTQYARDYEGEVTGEDEVSGEATWRLELRARAKDVTYDRIRYWISKARRLAVKAEFLTVGGDVFKTATFEYGNRLRVPRGETFELVSRMVIRDAMGAEAVTELTFDAPRAEVHAASLFNVNNVAR